MGLAVIDFQIKSKAIHTAGSGFLKLFVMIFCTRQSVAAYIFISFKSLKIND